MILGIDGAEADLDRELGAITVKPIQLQARTHASDLRLREIVGPVPHVAPTEAPWDERLERLAENVFAAVSEKLFRLRVDDDDRPSSVRDDNGVGCSFQKASVGGVNHSSTPRVMRARILRDGGNVIEFMKMVSRTLSRSIASG